MTFEVMKQGESMSDVQERPLTSEEEAEFQDVATRALANLGVGDAQAAPDAIVKLVDGYVDKWQTGGFAPRRSLFRRSQPMPDSIDVALGLGAVWGNQLARKFGWEWVCLNREGQELYGVVSPNRGWVIYPTYFIKACLDNPQADCTAMLSFNMIEAGSVPENSENAYENLMAGVQRVIPKR